MKTLRKSFNGKDKDPRPAISTPLPMPLVSKPPSAILPPQKVIRAQDSYKSQAPQELSFVKGDFFYVAKDADGQGVWYEAHNPVTGARGLVPRALFEEFKKNAPPIHTSQAGSKTLAHRPQQHPKTPVFYAVVLHDFAAERTDELEARRGDAITVVAQSNREWFVAKPIGRLGRPGLIPVSFVEVRDPSTGRPISDIEDLMDRGELPKVEDWKRAMLNYKQNSISLGVIDAPGRGSVNDSPFVKQNAAESPPMQTMDRTRPPTPDLMPEGILLSAKVVSFHYEMEEYWFRIDGLFQPYGSPDHGPLPPAKQLILFRVYNDFYDFQVMLLDAFPVEAGRRPNHDRILPYMPGPAQDVDDALTATRRAELDKYLRRLCDLKKAGAKYILEHEVVRRFLALKPGDMDHDVDSQTEEIEALSLSYSPQEDDDDKPSQELRMKMSQLKATSGARKDSDYEDENYAQSERYSQNGESRLPGGRQSHQDSHRPANSISSTWLGSSLPSQSKSPSREYASSPQPSRNDSTASTRSRWTDTLQHTSSSTPSTSSYRASNSTSTSRSRALSNANTNVNNPPISAANQQTAFVKIKIFDRLADDLIAIRVHPKVTHAELMGKVQARLGGEVGNLRYRDSVKNTFVPLGTDDELREWIEGTDKHVLFAD